MSAHPVIERNILHSILSWSDLVGLENWEDARKAQNIWTKQKWNHTLSCWLPEFSRPAAAAHPSNSRCFPHTYQFIVLQACAEKTLGALQALMKSLLSSDQVIELIVVGFCSSSGWFCSAKPSAVSNPLAACVGWMMMVGVWHHPSVTTKFTEEKCSS